MLMGRLVSFVIKTAILSFMRCINLDWLECFVLEPPVSRGADYFRSLGLFISVREYGTRVYNEMFTIYDDDGMPSIEVRRSPVSNVLPKEASHLRLVNRYCYFDDAAKVMRDFIAAHDYTFVRISRVDICMDFVKFDSGDDPCKFLQRYIRHKYAKINQGRITAHGDDTWNGLVWNSVSWGSKSSDISTKMYCKTLELWDPVSQTYKKPYIRQAWALCGLVDDPINCTLADGSRPDVWRVEFSIRSSVHNWFVIHPNGCKEKQSIRNTLDCYDSRGKLLTMFASLQRHYFFFRYFRESVRKDRCPEKVLFQWGKLQSVYHVGSHVLGDGHNMFSDVRGKEKLIAKLRLLRATHKTSDVERAVSVLVSLLQDDIVKANLARPFDADEVFYLRRLIASRSRGDGREASVILNEIRELLHIGKHVVTF